MAEDRRIALAALAVTAVVGIAAPTGTVLATNAHDSHRLKSEQKQSDRQELRRVQQSDRQELRRVQQSDRQELRRVLDRHGRQGGTERPLERDRPVHAIASTS